MRFMLAVTLLCTGILIGRWGAKRPYVMREIHGVHPGSGDDSNRIASDALNKRLESKTGPTCDSSHTRWPASITPALARPDEDHLLSQLSALPFSKVQFFYNKIHEQWDARIYGSLGGGSYLEPEDQQEEFEKSYNALTSSSLQRSKFWKGTFELPTQSGGLECFLFVELSEEKSQYDGGYSRYVSGRMMFRMNGKFLSVSRGFFGSEGNARKIDEGYYFSVETYDTDELGKYVSLILVPLPESSSVTKFVPGFSDNWLTADSVNWEISNAEDRNQFFDSHVPLKPVAEE